MAKLKLVMGIEVIQKIIPLRPNPLPSISNFIAKRKKVSINFCMLLREIFGGFQFVSDRKLKFFAVHN